MHHITIDFHAYLSTILLNSILVDLNDKHYPQILLKKCVCTVDKQALLDKYIDKFNDKSNDESNNKSDDKF